MEHSHHSVLIVEDQHLILSLLKEIVGKKILQSILRLTDRPDWTFTKHIIQRLLSLISTCPGWMVLR